VRGLGLLAQNALLWERIAGLSPDFGIRTSGDGARCWEMLGVSKFGVKKGFGKNNFDRLGNGQISR
jgi:hypothetical protein